MNETVLQTAYVNLMAVGPDPNRVASELTEIYAKNQRVKFLNVTPMTTKVYELGDVTRTAYGAFLTYWAPPGYKLKLPEWTV